MKWFSRLRFGRVNGKSITRSRAQKAPRRQLVLETLGDRILLASVVTNTLPAGAGSLLAAITAENASDTHGLITFNIPGPGPYVINLSAPLPPLTNPAGVTIDGYTQPGASPNTLPAGDNANLLIELNGASAGASANALVITGGATTVRGLVINGFDGHGIWLRSSGGNVVEGNFLGTDPTGTANRPNRLWSVFIDGTPGNVIGGTTAAARNLISGNDNGHDEEGTGVWIAGRGATGNLVQGNFIGTDRTGTLDLGNRWYGVAIGQGASNNTVGGTTPGARNIISGHNRFGVEIGGEQDSPVTGNVVAGNYIGTDVTGTQALGNHFYGVILAGYASGNTIGGTVAGARNVIAANDGANVLLLGSNVTGNLVQGNYIGTNAAGTASLGLTSNGVYLQTAPNNTVGGAVAGAGNLIWGWFLGVNISFGSPGSVVQGNYIGTDATGTYSLGSPYPLQTGVYVSDPNATIGGTAPMARNVIAGNNYANVKIAGSAAAGTRVQGNYIGTTAAGTAAVGNNGIGVYLADARSVTIGGDTPAARNVIAGNSSTGLLIEGSGATNNVVLGNYIGTDYTGMLTLGNGLNGAAITLGASNNTIGGLTAGTRNVISGNGDNGVQIYLSSGNAVLGNYIGTDVSGRVALGNAHDGVRISGTNNTVGGTAPGASNVISGNGDGTPGNGNGAHIDPTGTNNVVADNFIGTDFTGTSALGNLNDGVLIDGASNTIGGPGGAGNVISANALNGVEISPNATGNTVAGNFIGTDLAGANPLSNGNDGVLINGSNNTIGGVAGNLISGNALNGVEVSLGATSDTVTGNIIGTDRVGANPLGNGSDGVLLDGSNNTVGGPAGAYNLISGNAFNGVHCGLQATRNAVVGNFIGTDFNGRFALSNGNDGVLIDGSNNTVGGAAFSNLLSGNGANGVEISPGATNNLVVGNYVGTDATGTSALPNFRGIYILGDQNTVGGTTAADRNVVSGNGGYGIEILGKFDAVTGNFIGTDRSGTAAVPNGLDGVIIHGSDNTIGGTTAGARNVISGNGVNGVNIFAGAGKNVVAGNYIGTDVTGNNRLSNLSDGVLVSVSNNTIGGTATGAGNVISGNALHGVEIQTSNNVVQGNAVGTNAFRVAPLGNGGHGVYVFGGANTIGGTVTGAGNVIAGNNWDGVAIASYNNVVQGNAIGTNAAQAAGLGNAGNGVAVYSALGNAIGGTASGAGNTIAFNGNDGVLVDTGTGNACRCNSIFSNGNLGIELLRGGNLMLPAPTLTRLSATSILVTFRGTPFTTYSFDFFTNTVCDPSGFGEGATPLVCGIPMTTDASGNVTFGIGPPAGVFITATVTDPGNNTSQFSNCV
jgi:hypothetical protein